MVYWRCDTSYVPDYLQAVSAYKYIANTLCNTLLEPAGFSVTTYMFASSARLQIYEKRLLGSSYLPAHPSVRPSVSPHGTIHIFMKLDI